MAQEAVVTFGWLQPGEMIDGLALAETTPGPLVLVLTFVGLLATYRDSLGFDPLPSSVIRAALTTWATFVPCFLCTFLARLTSSGCATTRQCPARWRPLLLRS